VTSAITPPLCTLGPAAYSSYIGNLKVQIHKPYLLHVVQCVHTASALPSAVSMRLLQLGDNDELSLVEFIGSDIPPYAILSHTWGPNNSEVTCRGVVEGTGKSKRGYQKILWCGRQAAKNSLEYFWVDTCCIDKTSSAELSEAINSMYRWYEEAEVCYAYLEDVPPNMPVSEWSTANIKWFTRGWTLQELLAPELLEFFANDWTSLGTKFDHCHELATITGIHVRALRYARVEEFSIAQRMYWACNRTTTRPEDIAYCLIGIFDVNMPLLYGEGAIKAFVRLQEEIMKESNDQSIFPWAQQFPVSSPYHSLLADSPRDFASAGAIVRRSQNYSDDTYSMTNAGLCIRLPMIPIHSPYMNNQQWYLGVLDCMAKSSPPSVQNQQRITLYLQRLIYEGDQYARMFIEQLKYLPSEWNDHSDRRAIFVRKDPLNVPPPPSTVRGTTSPTCGFQFSEALLCHLRVCFVRV